MGDRPLTERPPRTREKRGARQAVRGPVVLAAATGPGPRGPGCVRREPSLARPRHHGAQPCRGSGSSRSLSSLLLPLRVSVLWLVSFPALWGSSRRRWAPLGVTGEEWGRSLIQHNRKGINRNQNHIARCEVDTKAYVLRLHNPESQTPALPFFSWVTIDKFLLLRASASLSVIMVNNIYILMWL